MICRVAAMVAARLRYVAAMVWGEKRYLDMKRLRELEEEQRNLSRE